MRFLDSSVFLHAYLKPPRKLKPFEKNVKEKAKEIIIKVNAGEEDVLMTVIHLSEIVNLIESRVSLRESIMFLAKIFSMRNVAIANVSRDDYEKTLAISSRYYVSVNDALAYIKMREHGINEIYTFDKHFKNLPGIKILP